MGLRPWEFGRLTPAEFEEMLAAHERAHERMWELAAWVVQHLYAPHMRKGKKPPSVDKLLGRSKTRRE